MDHNRALVMAMKSYYDTIVLDRRPEPWVFAPLKIWEAKNKVLILESGVEVRAKKNAFKKTSNSLWQFILCENIQILGNGATFSMNKEEYIEGEWRHGISLRACKDVEIRDITIRDSGGDGIYLAGWNQKGTFSENITIDGIQSINNKRQGISIISARNVKISNSLFAETKGTLPSAGLDIEPDHPEDVISQIEITDCIFRDNDHAGIMLGLGKLDENSHPISIVIRNSILRNNHVPTHPRSAAEVIIGANRESPVKGNVLFDKCVFEDSKWGIFYSRKRSDAFTVTFTDCIGRNICKDGSWPPVYLEVPEYHKKTGPLGGFVFKNLYLEYDTKLPFMIVRGSKMGTLENLADIQGDVTIAAPDHDYFNYINYNPEKNRNVKVKFTKKVN